MEKGKTETLLIRWISSLAFLVSNPAPFYGWVVLHCTHYNLFLQLELLVALQLQRQVVTRDWVACCKAENVTWLFNRKKTCQPLDYTCPDLQKKWSGESACSWSLQRCTEQKNAGNKMSIVRGLAWSWWAHITLYYTPPQKNQKNVSMPLG